MKTVEADDLTKRQNVKNKEKGAKGQTLGWTECKSWISFSVFLTVPVSNVADSYVRAKSQVFK